MQTVTQNIESEMIALALDTSGDPVLALAFGDVSVSYKKYDSTDWVAKTLTDDDWYEVGDGVYVVTFSEDELDTAGSFVFKLEGDTIATYIEVANVESDGSSDSIDMPVCTVSGYVYNLTGDAVEGAAVTVRVLGFPTVVDSLAAITDSTATAYTDENGYFELALVREAYVDISIPKANYRRQLTVPDSATASLFSIA